MDELAAYEFAYPVYGIVDEERLKDDPSAFPATLFAVPGDGGRRTLPLFTDELSVERYFAKAAESRHGTFDVSNPYSLAGLVTEFRDSGGTHVCVDPEPGTDSSRWVWTVDAFIDKISRARGGLDSRYEPSNDADADRPPADNAG